MITLFDYRPIITRFPTTKTGSRPKSIRQSGDTECADTVECVFSQVITPRVTISANHVVSVQCKNGPFQNLRKTAPS